MGYATHELELSGPALEIQEVITSLLASDGASYALELEQAPRTGTDVSIGAADSSKWYEWKEDLARASLAAPNVFFEVSGEGEESPDTWKAYLKNGKCQVAETTITYEPFSAAKLERVKL